MASASCSPDSQFGIIYQQYTLTLINASFAIFALFAIIIYIKAYVTNKLKGNRLIFFVGLTFYIINLTSTIANAFVRAQECQDTEYKHILININTQTYAAQTFLYLSILYYRLYFIFRDTFFPLSRCTNVCFWTYYILTCSMGTYSAIMWSNSHSKSGLTTAITGIMVILLIFFISFLFIYKIFNVYKASRTQDSDDEFLQIITKTAILLFVSTSVTLLLYIFAALEPKINSIYWSAMRQTIGSLDRVSNFVCILLSYQVFASWYIRLCGCCHFKCHNLWTRCCLKGSDQRTIRRVVTDSNVPSTTATDRDTRERAEEQI